MLASSWHGLGPTPRVLSPLGPRLLHRKHLCQHQSKIKEVNVLQPRPVQVDNNSAKSDEYYDEQRFTEN